MQDEPEWRRITVDPYIKYEIITEFLIDYKLKKN